MTRGQHAWLTVSRAIALAVFIQTLLPAVATASLPKPPGIAAGSAVLMDWETGEVLFQKEMHAERSPASTTKVMTALIALERGRLDDLVTVSKRAAYTSGSSMHIKPGQVYSLHDLLHGLLLRSGNDAAVAIAEHLAGSVEAFALLMNQRARELGAVHTHFTNPHGLTDPLHLSTAFDLALITRAALRNPLFANMVALKSQTLNLEQLGLEVTLNNTNRLLHIVEGADGVKTGTTSAAGPCLIFSATRDEQRLIGVVLRAGNRWSESAQILEWGFKHFRLARLGRADEILLEAPVIRGKLERVPVKFDRPLSVVVSPDGSVPDPHVELQEVEAPIVVGQTIGRIKVTSPGGVTSEALLIAATDVPKATLFELFYRRMQPLVRWLYSD